VEECDDDDVATEEEQRNQVVDGEREQAVRAVVEIGQVRPDEHHSEGRETAKEMTKEHRSVRIEVIDVTRPVADSKIDVPAKAEREPWEHLPVGVLFGPSERIEHLVLVNIACEFVVIAMTQLPLIKRDHEKAVRKRANDVIE